MTWWASSWWWVASATLWGVGIFAGVVSWAIFYGTADTAARLRGHFRWFWLWSVARLVVVPAVFILWPVLAIAGVEGESVEAGRKAWLDDRARVLGDAVRREARAGDLTIVEHDR